MTSKEPYYPNNWKKFKDAPDEAFKSLSFEEFHDWRVCNWELPESVHCIIRCENTKTGKVKEYSYNRRMPAMKRLESLLQDQANEITIVDNEEIHLLKCEDIFGIDPDQLG